MAVLLKYLNFIIGALAIVGGVIPINDIIQVGSVGCSDALGFAVLAGGIILLGATYYIDKGDSNKKHLYFLSTLVLSFIISAGIQYIIQSAYGVAGQFDKCTLFI
jgi:hypothetical protein